MLIRLKLSICLALCWSIILLSGCAILQEQSPEVERPGNKRCVVLALPNSGRYAAISSKIRQGAEAAINQARKSGLEVRFENINTENPDWLQKLDQLPPMCTVIGGPLTESKYSEAKKAGLTDKRAFFTFLSSLPQGDEGVKAWRFFSSPQDQINALVRFAVNDLKVSSMGAFYPDDAYGRRMTGILANALKQRHIALHEVAYNPADIASWNGKMRVLINSVQTDGVKNPIPQTRFEAIFLPDSWKNMDSITNIMINNGEDRLVLLGANLWGQAVMGKSVQHPEKFALAVFPSEWDPGRTPTAIKMPNMEMWHALGYDFANFSIAFAIMRRLEHQDMPKRIQQASSSIKALAPLHWNNQGIASQNLFIFQVGPKGAVPMNLESFIQKRNAIQERAALRMQGIPEQESAETEPVSSPPIESTPVTAPVAVPEPVVEETPQMPVIPQSSYKLRLPGKK